MIPRRNIWWRQRMCSVIFRCWNQCFYLRILGTLVRESILRSTECFRSGFLKVDTKLARHGCFHIHIKCPNHLAWNQRWFQFDVVQCLGFQQFAKVLLFPQSLYVFQFDLVLFKLELRQQQLFLSRLSSFVLQPTGVWLLGVATQVSQLSFFVRQRVIASPFVLVIRFCSFPRWVYCILTFDLIFFFLQQPPKLELLEVQLTQPIAFSDFQLQLFSFIQGEPHIIFFVLLVLIVVLSYI